MAGFPYRPSRLLHSPELKEEVIERLRHQWPAAPDEWHALRKGMMRGPRTSAIIPEWETELEAPPAGPLRPESFESPHLILEAVVRRVARPAILVQDNLPQPAETDYWRQKLQTAESAINKIPAIGRIELKNHVTKSWNGTGWLVRDDLIVTNAHVAVDFAVRGNGSWTARINPMNKTIKPRIDFREEYQRDTEEEAEVSEIVFVEERNDQPDIAILRITRGGAPRPVIDLASAGEITLEQEVVTIGYPKNDSSVEDPELLKSIFDNVFDVKRISPGIITSYPGKYLTHDCSTLGGNSGSAVISLKTGRAVGLHFGGSYLVDNFAVPASAISELLSRLGL